MEIKKVEIDADFKSDVISVLKTIVSNEDLEDILEGITLALEDGSDLYTVSKSADVLGFFIMTPLLDENGSSIELLTMDEIWIKEDSEKILLENDFGEEIKKISSSYKAQETEVIITQTLSWLGQTLIDVGYVCSEVKFEKVLPTPGNLGDVLELIQDCTPIDRIVQVLLEKDHELKAEVVEDTQEIDDILSDGWVPVIVVVTFEPDGLNIEETITNSDQIMNWDDYNLIYRGD